MNTTTRKILWDEDGRTGCTLHGHAPFKGTDTWRSGRWRAIRADEAAAFEREVGHPPECETCAAAARRSKEQARAEIEALIVQHGEGDGRLIDLSSGVLGFFFAGEMRFTGSPSELLPHVHAYFTEPV